MAETEDVEMRQTSGWIMGMASRNHRGLTRGRRKAGGGHPSDSVASQLEDGPGVWEGQRAAPPWSLWKNTALLPAQPRPGEPMPHGLSAP